MFHPRMHLDKMQRGQSMGLVAHPTNNATHARAINKQNLGWIYISNLLYVIIVTVKVLFRKENRESHQ